VAAVCLPVSLEAASVCASNAYGQFLRFEGRDRCRAGSNGSGAIHGRWHSGFLCNGSTVLPLHGACAGDPLTGTAVVSIISEAHGDGCVQVTWHMNGSAINDATGNYDNAPFGDVGGPDSWTPADCADEPPLGQQLEPPPGPLPGRQ
jgi:hypothetical protein